MSIHDYISFNSNEEYERSIFQFVQMAGGMTIKDAKQHLDQVIDRTFSKNRFLTYKCSSRNRSGNTLYAFDTGFRFQHGQERIFAYTLKNTRRDEENPKALLRAVHGTGNHAARHRSLPHQPLACRGHCFRQHRRHETALLSRLCGKKRCMKTGRFPITRPRSATRS